MERSVAIKKLGKLLGKDFGYRVDSKAPSLEERDAAKAELDVARAERDKLKEKRDERYKAILAADAEYQSLRAAHHVAEERTSQLSGIIYRKKITVGASNGIFFLVKAEGDSWEEVINKVESK